MGKFSVSGWLKMLTLEGAIEGNINTVDEEGKVHSSRSGPFPLTEFLLLSAPFSPWPFSPLLSCGKLQFMPFFPYLAKGADDKNEVSSATTLHFCPLIGLWQVSEAVMKCLINQNHLPGHLTCATAIL